MKSILNRRTNIFTSLAFVLATLSISNIANAQDAQSARADIGPDVEANVNDGECFPTCRPAAASSAKEIEPPKAIACGRQPTDLIKQVEQLNDRVKPIKEIVGYIRSPQGLAIKLVNDHVVKIPVWVGYAMDPVGSLKNRAMDEVRTRAKSAIGLNSKAESCAAEIATPIDAALIPIDTQQI